MSIDFDIHKKYILACSFGPDSMALFDMLYKTKCQFIVCFVNYHKRKESNNEQEQIIKYCHQKKIVCEVLDLKNTSVVGNFQNWARNVRYNFFANMCAKYKAKGVFVAHHQDDLIETYIMQKKNCKNYVEYYGLKKISFIKNVIIIRPLLEYTKKELFDYCKKHDVPFSLDISNSDLSFLRNKIRHDVIEKLDEKKRKIILEKIKLDNFERCLLRNKIQKIINFNDNKLNINSLLKLTKQEFNEAIMCFLKQHLPVYSKISFNFIDSIYNVLVSPKPNIKIRFKKIELLKEYDNLLISNSNENNSKKYCYFLKMPGKLFTNEIDVDFSFGSNEKKIFLEDYPITIRSPYENDQVKIKNYKRQLKKLFIDWKMPVRLRRLWPVFCDKYGKILYVPRYRRHGYKNDPKINIKIL
ncbi:MAG: tRNA lysidine(34) synthetase TilS [Bacilli bacterium]|nr:tRNA lysidine(34) synthetase TilS [Bacilli bacterium]